MISQLLMCSLGKAQCITRHSFAYTFTESHIKIPNEQMTKQTVNCVLTETDAEKQPGGSVRQTTQQVLT